MIVFFMVEFVFVYFGDIKQEKVKINGDKLQTTGQMIEIKDEIDEEILNEIAVQDYNLEILEEDLGSELVVEEELNNEIFKEDNIQVIDENNNEGFIENEIVDNHDLFEIKSTYNENAFIDGHLKEYPMFRRKIWEFNYK